MKRLLFTVVLVPIVGLSQPTYFNSAVNPADNSSQAGPTVAVTPPSSMQTGDLVVLVAAYKNDGVTMAMSETSGQTWTAETQVGSATSGLTLRLFWCRFNGTWGSNPSVTITSGTLAMTVHMHVFRPTSTSKLWEVAATISTSESTAAQNSPPVNITLDPTWVGVYAACSNDDNTYSNISAGYTAAGASYYRNLQGQDLATAAQYRIEGTTQSQTGRFAQITNGNDTWAALAIGFREYTATARPRRVTIIY